MIYVKLNVLHFAIQPTRALAALHAAEIVHYARDTARLRLVELIRGPPRASARLSITRWREAIREALEPNAQLMVNFRSCLETGNRGRSSF